MAAHKKYLNRRRFLQGAGGVVVALPFLEAFGASRAAAQGAARPRRIIVGAYLMGLVNEHWKPTGPDANPTLPYILEPFEGIKDKCLFISESYRGVTRDTGTHNGHECVPRSAFTNTVQQAYFTSGGNHVNNLRGSVSSDEFRGSPANGESIETLVGRSLRTSNHSRDAVNLSVASNGKGFGYPSDSGGFFFEGPGVEVSCEYNPRKAYNELFSGLEGGNPTVDRLQERKKSVLDAVRESFNALRRDLGRDDQQRLDAHAERIRDIEVEIQYSESCQAPVLSPGELPSASQNPGESDRDYMDRLFGQTVPNGNTSAPMSVTAPLQVKILAHAMACDIAPVGRLSFSFGDNPFFGIPSVDSEIQYYQTQRWHNLIHTVGSNFNSRTRMNSRPSDGGPGYYAPELLDGTRFYWQQFADLCDLLDQIPDGMNGESVLDNSLCVFTSDFGEGEGHGPRDTGFVLAGNLAGGQRGRHLRLDPLGYHDSHVLNSVAQIFDVRDGSGAPITAFGLQGFVQGGIPQVFSP